MYFMALLSDGFKLYYIPFQMPNLTLQSIDINRIYWYGFTYLVFASKEVIAKHSNSLC